MQAKQDEMKRVEEENKSEKILEAMKGGQSYQKCAALSRKTWPLQVYKITKIESSNPVTGYQEDLAHFMVINATNEDSMTKCIKTRYSVVANQLDSHSLVGKSKSW